MHLKILIKNAKQKQRNGREIKVADKRNIMFSPRDFTNNSIFCT